MKSFLSRAFKGSAKPAGHRQQPKETAEEESARQLEQALPAFVVSEVEDRIRSCAASQCAVRAAPASSRRCFACRAPRDLPRLPKQNAVALPAAWRHALTDDAGCDPQATRAHRPWQTRMPT